jgi:hypothetical protein
MLFLHFPKTPTLSPQWAYDPNMHHFQGLGKGKLQQKLTLNQNQTPLHSPLSTLANQYWICNNPSNLGTRGTLALKQLHSWGERTGESGLCLHLCSGKVDESSFHFSPYKLNANSISDIKTFESSYQLSFHRRIWREMGMLVQRGIISCHL